MTKKGEPAEPLYGRELFSIIAKTFLGDMGAAYLDIRDTGVWLISDEPGTPFSWAPACDLEGPGGPYPFTSPALPFPFTAKQLAAWMLGGWGSLVGEAVFDSDPDADALANAERAFLRLGYWSREARDVLMCAYEERGLASRRVQLMMRAEGINGADVASAAQFERGDPFGISEELCDAVAETLRIRLVRHLLGAPASNGPTSALSPVHQAAAEHMNSVRRGRYQALNDRIASLWKELSARGVSKNEAVVEIAKAVAYAESTVRKKLQKL